jgi:dTDP-4-dehydrorhamnose reductase
MLSLFKRPLIIGGKGQLGRAFLELLENALSLDRSSWDLKDPFPKKLFNELNPTSLFLTAAYTKVDEAEKEKELAYHINATIPGILSEYAQEKKIPFIFFSSDYVFSGEKKTPYQENDLREPLNYYGFTKKEGEDLIIKNGGDFFIFRTSWVYDAFGKNFVTTMRRLFLEKKEVSVVADQWGAPSYAPHLAKGTIKALQNFYHPGVYHLTSQGKVSWFLFAEKILAHMKAQFPDLPCQKIIPILSKNYLTPARRPKNSLLDNAHFFQTYQFYLPSWEEGLKECFLLTP